MKLLVAGEYRFRRGADGNIYADGVFDATFWSRYLEVFDGVVVAARVDSDGGEIGRSRVNGAGVTVHELPYYVGLLGYAKNWIRLRKSVREAVGSGNAVLLRAPGPISAMFHAALDRGRPFGAEIVGDPYEVLSALPAPARQILRTLAARTLRRITQTADSVAYVSKTILPKRYPPGPKSYVAYYSSVTLPPEAFRDVLARPGPIRIVAVGSMEQEYKGFDTILDAVSRLRRTDFDSLTILGDGRYRQTYESMAVELGIDHLVHFKGTIANPEGVRAELDRADLFISGSRTEGLPRAMIEAMARGLPCIGTAVGGTPELLPGDALCNPNDARALTDLISRHTSLNARVSLAEACRDRSKDYALDVLDRRRASHYRHLRDSTATWEQARKQATL